MFLTVHTTAAFWLAKLIPNPIFAFIAGFVSHLVLDAIPHGDELIFLEPKTNKLKMKKFVMAAIADVIIASLWIYILIQIDEPQYIAAVIAAVIGSVLPDIVMGGYMLTKSPLLKWGQDINQWAHKLILKHPINPLPGISIQILTVILFWLLIFG